MRIENPDQISAPPDGRSHDVQPKWRQAFPIDWPRDEHRSRRDFTKLLGLTSFAFMVGQAWIVTLSWLKGSRKTPPPTQLATVADLPVGAAKLFHYPTPLDPCLLVRVSENEFVAFGQKCTHLSCPVIPRVAEGIFHCPCHAGAFDLKSGFPIAGPPRRPLPRVLLEVRDGKVFATGVATQSKV
jgi:nitrite reductase/ring-hydroxylating ferredoxin subunit